jgi:hypothetical protein
MVNIDLYQMYKIQSASLLFLLFNCNDDNPSLCLEAYQPHLQSFIVIYRENLNELPVSLELFGKYAIWSDDSRLGGMTEDLKVTIFYDIDILCPFLRSPFIEFRIRILDKFLGIVIQCKEGC